MLCENVKSMMMYVIIMAQLSYSKPGKLTDFPNSNLESSLTFLIQIWKLSKSQFGKSTNLTSKNHVVRKDLFFIMHVCGVFLHIPILSTSVY